MFVFIVVVSAAIVMMAIEAKWPARNYPKVKGWHVRAILLNLVQAAMVPIAGYLWDDWMKAHAIFSLRHLDEYVGGFVGYLAITFTFYWWHRFRHQFDVLWLLFHQVHHSPQRITIITSFYKHPLEIAANGVICSALLYLLMGLTPAAATNAFLLSGLAELVYHWNVHTPRWLGWFFQRPEMHCYHHEKGKHQRNYGDLPLWDMLFGTYYNPPRFESECGFSENREYRLWDMLLFRDVHKAGRWVGNLFRSRKSGPGGETARH